jgi:iduronate 2-sulfatase
VPLLTDVQTPWAFPAVTQVQRGTAPETFVGYSLRTDRWRYTEWDGGRRGTELYDAEADPDELRNVAALPANSSTVVDLQRQLRRLVAESAGRP